MQGTNDVDQTARADDGDGLDPGEAARLLAQTEREARRQFNLSPQWINAVMGAVILVAYGSLWLSTRGQHPYKGPSLGVVALVYTAVAVGIAASKADWPQFGAALAVVTGGVVAAFVGPSGAWLAAGITLFVAVIGYTAATGKRLRRT